MDFNHQQHSKVSDIPSNVIDFQDIENDEIKKAFKNQAEILQRQRLDREWMLKNIDNLTKEQLIRLSRSSYLKHVNRFNVQ